MSHQDNHVINIHPDDEAIEFEMNHELGNQEQREIDRRVQRALARRDGRTDS
jgi:hypothetical protein